MGMVDDLLKTNAQEFDFVVKVTKKERDGHEGFEVTVNASELDMFKALMAIMQSYIDEDHEEVVRGAMVTIGYDNGWIGEEDDTDN